MGTSQEVQPTEGRLQETIGKRRMGRLKMLMQDTEQPLKRRRTSDRHSLSGARVLLCCLRHQKSPGLVRDTLLPWFGDQNFSHAVGQQQEAYTQYREMQTADVHSLCSRPVVIQS